MGKAVEKKRKKKKGRPSLLDLQKRQLQQQQQQQQLLLKKSLKKTPNPNPNSRRSTRRNPNPNPSSDEESTGKRREKKLKLVLDEAEDNLGLGSGSGSEPDDEGSNPRKRKIDSIARGSGFSYNDKGEKHSDSGVANQASIQQGSKLDDGPSTPLPDKKLLLFILDRLQKKDTFGVFTDPVDPEELPDYHEVIEHPMDFTTIRKKLADGVYVHLEQFEKDVFLLCSNAMQYNAPDTIYFRQARSIQELAKKNFENLRQDSDDNEPEQEQEPEPKVVRRGRPPTKNLKRPPGRPSIERANSNFSEATLATAGGITNRPNNDRKGPPLSEQQGSTGMLTRATYSFRLGDAYIGWSAERNEKSEDMIGSASKGIAMKNGKKNIVLDESRRNTYKLTYAQACRQETSVLTTFKGERKLLIPVGLHAEYGYARSLSRFAAKLGPAAWRVTSAKINKCLPAGVKFGPGWVGESEAPSERPTQQQAPVAASQPSPAASTPTQVIVESVIGESAQKPKDEQSSEVPAPSNESKLEDDGSSSAPDLPSVGNDATQISSPMLIATDRDGPKSSSPVVSAGLPPYTPFNTVNGNSGSVRPRINGLNGGYGHNFAVQMGKILGATRPGGFNHQPGPSVPTSRTSGDNHSGVGEANSLENSSATIPSASVPNAGLNQKASSGPPDLNVGFQTTGSPGSGRSDSVQPDLALQL